MFVIGSWLFLYVVVKILNCLQLPSNKQLKEYTDQMKADTIELLDKYSPLPIDISKEIVNHYVYDHEQTSFLSRMIKSKLNSQHRYTQIFITSYAIISMFAHLLCFVLIAWINTEWSNKNDIYETHSSFRSWIIAIFTYHPMWKFMNYAFSIHMLYADSKENDDDDDDTPSWYTGFNKLGAGHNRDKDIFEDTRTRFKYITIIGLPYVLVFFSCIFPSFFVYLIPGIIYYFPVTLFLCCITFIIGLIFVQYGNADLMNKLGLIDYKEIYKNIKITILFAIPFYLMFLMLISAMECNYSRDLNRKEFDGWDKYGICLYKGIIDTQGYCQSFYVDWNDWRAIVIFISWILF